jgi:hypothetical protein
MMRDVDADCDDQHDKGIWRGWVYQVTYNNG